MAQHNVKFLTKKEVALALNCSTRTIERRMKLGLIKFEKIGGSVRFDPTKIKALNKFVVN